MPYGAITDAAFGWKDGRIVFAGPQRHLPDDPAALCSAHESVDGQWISPGLIDCHTHVVFGGERAGEFEHRLEGVSYEEIARAGGGIASSVRATREAVKTNSSPPAAACRCPAPDGVTRWRSSPATASNGKRAAHAARARRIGRTGHRRAHDLPRRACAAAGYRGAPTTMSTCCAARCSLRSHGRTRRRGRRLLRRHRLFTCADRRVFEAARAHGLPVKLHADQLSDLGGAALLASLAA